MRKKLESKVIEMRLGLERQATSFYEIMKDRSGAGAFDRAIDIVVAVVLAGLLLAGLVAILNVTVMPGLTNKITGIFNFSA